MRHFLMLNALFASLLLLPAVLRAEDAPKEFPLWPNGAPGFEDRKDEKEVRNQKPGDEYTVTNVHSPTLTAFLPSKDKATGAAIVIVPGGGHREIWIVHEGINEAKWLADHGIACFVLKYRLAREPNSPYKLPDQPTQDGQRAIRFVRSHAAEWGIDPNRVGIMGFSAGGELAGYTASADGKGKADASDPIDRVSGRPDFAALIYPGPGGLKGETLTKEMNLPPTFMAVGDDDKLALVLLNHYLALKEVGVSAELHTYAKIPHGFGLRERDQGKPVHEWIQSLYDFLNTEGMLKKS
jgi:endo-1,4-beta-xylanase